MITEPFLILLTIWFEINITTYIWSKWIHQNMQLHDIVNNQERHKANSVSFTGNAKLLILAP